MKISLPIPVGSICAIAAAFALAGGPLRADDPAPKPLIDQTSPTAIKQVRANFGDPVFSVDASGISVQLPAARSNFPGIQVIPPDGTAAWDLSPYGDVEAKITNTGTNPLRLTMRVDGRAQDQPASDAETTGIKPGESKVFKVIFGYAWGYHPGAALEQDKITQVIIFADKKTFDQSFKVEDLEGAGSKGEKPPFNPDDVVTIPPNGVILGPGVTFDTAKQTLAQGGAQASAGTDGSLVLNFTGGQEQTVQIKPPMGTWNLNDANEIKVKFKNIGDTAVTPSVTIGSATTAASSPIAPGAEAEVAATFIPPPTVCESDYTKHITPGTGTTFESNKTKSFTITSDATPGPKSLLVTSIIADAPPIVLPDWVGKKPPVDGDWVETFDEEFNGPDIDTTKWNYYGHNYWDKRSHFSKNNLILKDGKCIFHYEKKTGFHNDDPTDKQTGQTAYATTFLCTYGKFTQRYGYFESRMKLPHARGLWPAFWLMPDRGKNSGSHYRVGTGKQPEDGNGVGGMEFDIVEQLSAWGVYRYNIAMIWDGYGKGMKQTGSTHNYVQTDKDGFFTAGLLWLPGQAIFYCNGKELLRWENPRVSDVQHYILYDMVSGGWEHDVLIDSQLPDDYVIDYCRVWQRKDLATPEDGMKPNKGDPSETKN
jgi:beta-glucanase (GH16 family)